MECFSKSNSCLSNIVNITISPDPGVAQNPGWSKTETVHAEEGKSTVSISQFQVQDIFNRRNIILLAIDSEDQVGEAVLLVARNNIKLVGEIISGSKLLNNLN